MANKKCPKCGEDNPAEAVMCWACYTPLTAGAGAAMGAGMGMGGAGAATLPRPGGPMGAPAPTDAGEKKQIDPKIFLLGGLILVGAVVAMFTSGMLGGGPTVPEGIGNAPIELTPFSGGNSGGTISGPVTPPLPPATTTSGPDIGGPPQQQAAYSMVVSPNPIYTTATFGITPSQPSASQQEALNLAKTARESVIRSGKWTNAQVVVFKDASSASSFRQYMGQRRGKPLGPGDYASLAGQGGWSGALVYYETRGKSGRVAYPANNPTHWW